MASFLAHAHGESWASPPVSETVDGRLPRGCFSPGTRGSQRGSAGQSCNVPPSPPLWRCLKRRWLLSCGDMMGWSAAAALPPLVNGSRLGERELTATRLWYGVYPAIRIRAESWLHRSRCRHHPHSLRNGPPIPGARRARRAKRGVGGLLVYNLLGPSIPLLLLLGISQAWF
jgi:hypothetical protein